LARAALGLAPLLLLLASCASSEVGRTDPAEVGPAITGQPADASVLLGDAATLSVTATGPGLLHYLWSKDGAVVGKDAASLSVRAAQAGDAGTYRVTVSNSFGVAVSRPATLSVDATPRPPRITAQPASLSLPEGSAGSLSVAATGTAPLHFQWRRGAAAVGSDQPLLAFSAVQTSDAGDYTVTVSNVAGAVTSAAATLTVPVIVRAPVITAQPADLSVAVGAAASFSVTATGTAPLHYQWSKDGAAVGADQATHSISSAALADAGHYAVVVSNAAGSATSTAATLAVVAQGFTISASAGAGGAISPSGAVAVAAGASQTFTLTPAAGQKIADVLVDGQSVGAVTSYTFTAVQAAHAIAASFSPVVVPGGDGVVWSDEFDGPSIDSSKWAFDLGNGPQNPGPLYGWGNGEMEYYTSAADNAAIEDGKLVITARRQDWGGQPFTSARLVTRGKYAFNQGRFVARIKMPEGNRMWPAFWLLGDRMEDWPFCGEIDIAEMFAGTNAGAYPASDYASFATAHWADAAGKHALNGQTYTLPTKLSAGYHDYELVWDATTLRGKIDGNEFWTLDITGPDKTELRDHSYFIVLNLAVGSPNFGMTSPAQADGVLPQRMYVDYVRVYSGTGSKVVDKTAAQPHGKFGIAADGTVTDAQLDLATDANVFLWNNLVAVSSTPFGGQSSLAVKTVGNAWFGFGVAATGRRNLLNYAAGYLNVAIKTTSTNNFKIGLNGGNDGDAWVDFKKGQDPYGFARDGQWHKVAIPMTRFAGADFSDIRQYFMVAGADAVTPGAIFEFDEIYWSENAPENQVRPQGTRFCVYSERTCDAGAFTPGTDGDILIWNTANGAAKTGTPSEGTASFALSAPAPVWYGLGLTPQKLYDLSAFAKGHLHVSLKVPASTITDFKLGLKSPGGQNVRESWLKFKRGADPYGFVRDGQYHQLVIPAGDLNNSDLKAVSLLFMVAGDGPASIEFDDVYWTAD
jgi:beta-glucanase (GH16 family)